MVFNLSIRTGEGGSFKMYACWDQKNGRSLASNLGQFRYYQFLRTIFWDFSNSFRDGSIEFCHPGDGNLCVTWQLPHSFPHADFAAKVSQGLQKVNDFDTNRYKDLFGIDIEMKQLAIEESGNSAISILHKHVTSMQNTVN